MRKSAIFYFVGPVLALLCAWAPANAAPALHTAELDVDGVGRKGSITVFPDGRVAVRRANGEIETLAFAGTPTLSAASVDVFSGLAGARYLRVEGKLEKGGRVLLLGALASPNGRLRDIYNGPVGPVGRDAEYAIELKVVEGTPLRYATTPMVRRCDGETRLFLERYAEPSGWHPAPELGLPALSRSSSLRPTVGGPAQFAARPPLGVYRFVAASAQAGIGRADLLTPPRELADGSERSAWRVTGDARGAFVTAQADGSGHAISALRIDAWKGPAKAESRGLPRRILLIFDQPPVIEVELLPTAATQWLVLPQPVASRCVSLVIAETQIEKPRAESALTAIGEVAIYSELDGSTGPTALFAQMAQGDPERVAGASRTLLSLLQRNPQLGAELLDPAFAFLKTAKTGASLPAWLRMQDVLLAAAEGLAKNSKASPQESAVLDRIAALIVQGLSLWPLEERASALAALARGGQMGGRCLRQVALFAGQHETLRESALTLLGEVGAAESARELLAAAPVLVQTPALRRGLVNGLAKALHCLPSDHPMLLEAEQRFSRALSPVSGQEAMGTRWELAATLASALSQAFVGCFEPTVRTRLAGLLAAAWPSAEAANQEAGTFLLRYRLLQAIERLAPQSPTSQALLVRVLEEENEPVLRQIAARALFLSTGQTLGLRDRDPGVRLATLAAMEGRVQAVIQGTGQGGFPSLQTGNPESDRGALAVVLGAIEERLLSDGWPQVRRMAAEVRAGACAAPPSPNRRPTAALRQALGDVDEKVQRQALLGVAHCEGSNATDVLSRMAKDRAVATQTRGLACALLARHSFAAGSAELRSSAHVAAAAALLDLLQDPAADERHAAALGQCLRGLGEFGDSSDVPALLEVVASEIPAALRQGAVRSMAAICARNVGFTKALRKQVLGLLKSSAKDGDTKLRTEAMKAEAVCQGGP